MHICVHTVQANVCLCQGRRTTEHHIKNTFISHSIVLQCNDKQVAPFRCCLQQRSALSTLLYISHTYARQYTFQFVLFFFLFYYYFEGENPIFLAFTAHTHTNTRLPEYVCFRFINNPSTNSMFVFLSHQKGQYTQRKTIVVKCGNQ